MVDIVQYRAAIGVFHTCLLNRKGFQSDFYFWSFIFPNFVFYNWVLPKLILLCGDVQINPGPNNKDISTHNINIGYVNVRSILAQVNDPSDLTKKVCKFELLKNHVLYYEYDIFGVSETWLDDSVSSSELLIPGYLPPIRRDISRHQGGSLVYISENIPARRRSDIEPLGSEIICCEVQINKLKLLICVCYRAPHFDVIDFTSDINDIIDAGTLNFHSVIFIGDFNARNAQFWSNDRSTAEGRVLFNIFHSQNYTQLIYEPTRVVSNCSSCIDLIFMNNQSIISNAGVRSQIGNCDHCPIFISLNKIITKPKSFKRWVWDLKRGDFNKFRSLLLDAAWENCYSHENFDDVVNEWMSLFTSIAEECVPHYETTIRPCDKSFMNSNLRRLMRKRDRLHSIFHRTNDPNIGQQYKDIRNQVVSEVRKAKEEILKHTDQCLSGTELSSRKWWSLCKAVANEKQTEHITPLIHENKIITDDLTKANIFNEYFISQSTLNETNAHLPNALPTCATSIDDKFVTAVDVYEILVNLDPSKATGPDGISNRLLKEAAVPISEPLADLFNHSLHIGQFPDIWKIANVTPIHKKNDAMLCTNYRPISLLPCISKVFEKILFEHIYTYLKANNLINRHQSGFTPGDSTINQLIAICNNIHKSLDVNDEVLAVFLDLSKAFDKVWHKGLLYKLELCGITGNLLDWLKSYLSGRKQKVVLNGASSSVLELHAGVPQGSVLGPLLFLIYINDISANLESDVYLFADDTSIFKKVNYDINSAATTINDDLEKIRKWSDNWLVSINPEKTVSMLFSSRRQPSKIPVMLLGQSIISSVDTHKHLGVHLSTNLSWGNHMCITIAKANK